MRQKLNIHRTGHFRLCQVQALLEDAIELDAVLLCARLRHISLNSTHQALYTCFRGGATFLRQAFLVCRVLCVLFCLLKGQFLFTWQMILEWANWAPYWPVSMSDGLLLAQDSRRVIPRQCIPCCPDSGRESSD